MDVGPLGTKGNPIRLVPNHEDIDRYITENLKSLMEQYEDARAVGLEQGHTQEKADLVGLLALIRSLLCGYSQLLNEKMIGILKARGLYVANEEGELL